MSFSSPVRCDVFSHTPRRCSLLLAILALTAGAARAQREVDRDEQPPRVSPRLSTAERTRLRAEAEQLQDDALEHHLHGRDLQALAHQRRALALHQKLYPADEYPAGHPDLAYDLCTVGIYLQTMGRLNEARDTLTQALAMSRTLYPVTKYPAGHAELARALSYLGYLQRVTGRFEEARAHLGEALALRRKLYPEAKYPDGHPELATSLNHWGALLKETGRFDEARGYYEQALAMRRKHYTLARYPDGHPELAAGLNNLGGLLQAAGQYEAARGYYEKALAAYQMLYPVDRFPTGHPHLAVALTNLGSLHLAAGRPDEARGYHEKALAAYQALYPVAKYPAGHPDLAAVLSNLAAALKAQERWAEARGHYERALAMRQKLSPAGHPDVATSLNDLGVLFGLANQPRQARVHLEKALALRRTLFPARQFPQGHPDLAQSLNNLGCLHDAEGRHEAARALINEALAMCRKLYPTDRYPAGHPDLARSLYNLGVALHAAGRSDQARESFEQSLVMYGRLAERYALAVGEVESFEFLRRLPQTRDGFLSASRRAPAAADRAHAVLWHARAVIARALARRQQAARLALRGDTATRRAWADLLDTRRELALLAPRAARDPAAHERAWAQLQRRKADRERELAALLPQRLLDQQDNAPGPADLAAALPPGAAFIDLYRYQDHAENRITGRYVAFVIRSDRAIRRVELGDAAAIDTACRAWRVAITRGADTPADAARVGALVWRPLAQALPAGTSTVYLAPDGELARLPWAALPGRKAGTVLLEERALAVVPHGPFLWERLKDGPARVGRPRSILAVGGVDYGPAAKGRYAPLPGTAAELRQLTALAGQRPVVALQGERATGRALQDALPRVRYAHLATHGFHDESALAAQRREQDAPSGRHMKDGIGRRLDLPVPLACTGLALAGANDPNSDGIVTGEALIGLPLDDLRLCVLSACESGLGDLGPVSGEPAQGLPRALHLAGCANVISSLWNVNDRATAALMSRFYHELWVAKRSPIEALRQAQLTILRHPGRIADLADRGRPDFARTVRLPAEPRALHQRAPTRLWAAFVLSGAGR